MNTEPVSPNSGAQRVVEDNKQSLNETLAHHLDQPLDTSADNESNTPGSNDNQIISPPTNIDTKPSMPTISHTPITPATPTNTTTTTNRPTTRTLKTTPTTTKPPTSRATLFKTLTPIQKTTRKRKLCSIKLKLKQKSVDELTDLYNSTSDIDFKTLMTEVYHENCMDRLEEWEERL